MRKVKAPRVAAGASATVGSGYWTGAHTMHRLRFHLVWIPKYRRRVLDGPVAARLTELLRQACEVREWGLHELSIQPDHVHLLVQVSPTDCVVVYGLCRRLRTVSSPTDCVSDVLGALKN